MVGGEDQDPRVGQGQEVDHVGVQPGAEIEDDEVGGQSVDGVDELPAGGVAQVGDLGDGVLGRADEGEVVKGAVRGVWYWMSRGVYGLGDIYSCIVPNPTDNPGHAFEEEWPWDALAN